MVAGCQVEQERPSADTLYFKAGEQDPKEAVTDERETCFLALSPLWPLAVVLCLEAPGSLCTQGQGSAPHNCVPTGCQAEGFRVGDRPLTSKAWPYLLTVSSHSPHVPWVDGV